MLGPLRHPKHSIFIKRVIIFKHFVVFASSASKSPKKLFKRTPKPPKTHRRGPQERPGVSWRRPGRPPNHPQSAPRASLALRKASGSHFQALLTSFSKAKETKQSQRHGKRKAPDRKHTQAHASNTQATRKHTQDTHTHTHTRTHSEEHIKASDGTL